MASGGQQGSCCGGSDQYVVVMDLAAGKNIINHELGAITVLASISDNVTGGEIVCRVPPFLAGSNSLTIVCAVPYANARVTIDA